MPNGVPSITQTLNQRKKPPQQVTPPAPQQMGAAAPTVTPTAATQGLTAAQQQFLPTVQKQLGQAAVAQAPAIRGAVGAGAEAVQKQIQQALAQQPGMQRDIEADRLAREQATEKQQLQDILGRTGRFGTAAGIRDVAALGAQQARTRADVLREAELAGRREQREAVGQAVQQAIGLGGLGVQERGQLGELALGAERIASGERIAAAGEAGATQRLREGFIFEGTQADLDRSLQQEIEAGRIGIEEAKLIQNEQMQLREFGNAEKLLGLEQAFTGNQNDLDRQLTREVEAGRITEQQADRASREWAVREQIKSDEDLAKMNLDWQREMHELDQILTRQGWDRERALEGARMRFKASQNALDRELAQDELAQQASQFKDRLAFDKWAEREGITEQQRTRAWQTQENAKDRAINEGELALQGMQLGLKGESLSLQQQELTGERIVRSPIVPTYDTEGNITGYTGGEIVSREPVLDANGQPVKGKLQLEADRLAETIRQGDMAAANDQWSRIISMAEVMEPEVGAQMIKDFAAENGVPIPKTIENEAEATAIQERATQNGVTVQQQAASEGVVWVGEDGMNAAPPGRSKDNPTVIGIENAPNGRIGITHLGAGVTDSAGTFIPFREGQVVEFERDMVSDLGFPIPAGKHEIVTRDQVPPEVWASLDNATGNVNWKTNLKNADTYFFDSTTGNYYPATFRGDDLGRRHVSGAIQGIGPLNANMPPRS